MLHSVPLINTPTIERLWPFQSGVHCLYYRPEPGGLTEAIESALRDRDALLRIAEQGRAYILQHHTRSNLVRHILSSVGLLDQADAVSVLESVERISAAKLGQVSTNIPSQDAAIKDLVQCSYVDSAYLVDRYGNALAALDPTKDPNITGSGGIFSATDLQDSDFLATASVMKMVVNGYAGAGTIEMGGFDYHDGTRATGEQRDFKAGQCIGACLEYAARVGLPLMIYVFSDGAIVSSGSLKIPVKCKAP